MIRTEKDGVMISGTKDQILKELVIIVHGLIYQTGFSEEDIDMAIETAKMTNEEIEKENDKMVSEIAMAAMLGALFKSMMNKDNLDKKPKNDLDKMLKNLYFGEED